jgi:Zn-dependent protease
LNVGFFPLGRVWGVELRWHWSVPLGALVLTRFRIEPGAWLGFLLVILVHELGHALLVKRLRFSVIGIDLLGFGGECRWRGNASGLERSWVAWGGVLAQAALLGGALLVRALWGVPNVPWVAAFVHALIDLNLWIIVINLLPIPPLDGAKAWRLFPELSAAGWTLGRAVLFPARRWAGRRRQQRTSAPPERAPASARSAGHGVPNSDIRGPEPEEEAAPSAEAQRELAALLERVAEEAAKARRRR